MKLIVDTGPLVALLDRRDPLHDWAEETFEELAPPYLTCDAVLTEASHFLFGVSATAAPLLMAVLLYRAIVGPPLPERLRPSWFILLVPPSLIYANGIALFPDFAPLENLYFLALVLAAALLLYARGMFRWPFGPPWWAFTFPLDALAYAASRYALDHPEPLWRLLAAVTLLLAAAFVMVALVRSLAALFR